MQLLWIMQLLSVRAGPLPPEPVTCLSSQGPPLMQVPGDREAGPGSPWQGARVVKGEEGCDRRRHVGAKVKGAVISRKEERY